MDSKTMIAKTPYFETNKRKDNRKRQLEMSDTIKKLKETLIKKGFKTELEVFSQEKVLFALVELISSEDLHPLFSPLVFDGTETREEKYERKNQQIGEKRSVAFSRMEEFIVGGGIGEWNKRPLSRQSILDAVLQFIQTKPSNAPTKVLKHNIDSILGDPRQPNSSSCSEQLPICSKTMKARTPYDKANKNKWQKEQRSEIKNIIGKMKKVLIRKGIKTDWEVSSQANVLFAVVEWICSEDLHQLFPPLVFNETETREEKNAQKKQRRIEKHNVAFSKMKEFIVGGGIGEWDKRSLSRNDILEVVLRFIRTKPPKASALPVPPMITNALPTGSESLGNPQTIQPPANPCLKHGVDSILKKPNLMNSHPQPIFNQSMHQFDTQSYISSLTLSNIFGQNQMLSPVRAEQMAMDQEASFSGHPTNSKSDSFIFSDLHC